MSTWFHWTGDELVLPTYVRAPHMRPPSGWPRCAPRPAVAVTIDTSTEPPQVLLLG